MKLRVVGRRVVLMALMMAGGPTVRAAETGTEVPKRVAVESSVIVSVGYDAVARTLDIEFHSGEVWRYFQVPVEIHRALLDAPSKGRFYNATIRHRFKSRKLADE